MLAEREMKVNASGLENEDDFGSIFNKGVEYKENETMNETGAQV